MTLEHNPYEAGLGWLVDLEAERGFVGRAALERIKAQGLQRKLVGVEIEGEPLDLNMVRWPVRTNQEQIGHVTSAAYFPRLQRNVGYAWAPIEWGVLGTRLQVKTAPDDLRWAKVVRKPLLDPNKNIPKG